MAHDQVKPLLAALEDGAVGGHRRRNRGVSPAARRGAREGRRVRRPRRRARARARARRVPRWARRRRVPREVRSPRRVRLRGGGGGRFQRRADGGFERGGGGDRRGRRRLRPRVREPRRRRREAVVLDRRRRRGLPRRRRVVPRRRGRRVALRRVRVMRSSLDFCARALRKPSFVGKSLLRAAKRRASFFARIIAPRGASHGVSDLYSHHPFLRGALAWGGRRLAAFT